MMRSCPEVPRARAREREREGGKRKKNKERERERSDGARRVRTRMYASIRVRE